MSDARPTAEKDARCWRSECFPGCYYPEACSEGGWHCAHEWMLRPESDTWECLICGVER